MAKGWIDGADLISGFMNNSPLFEERRLPTETKHYHQKPSGFRLLLTIENHLSQIKNKFHKRFKKVRTDTKRSYFFLNNI